MAKHNAKGRTRSVDRFERARATLVASFANGVVKDEATVRAAITSPWSNGQTEGQITSSSSSNDRCTAEESSTSCKLA